MSEMNKTHVCGKWILDEAGRVVQLHGLRLRFASSKITENSKDTRNIFKTGDEKTDITQAEIDLAVGEGFNAIRYNFDWATLEPEPGKLNDSMYDRIVETNQLLMENGVRTLIGMSHDAFSAKYRAGQGYGAPEWACINEEYQEREEDIKAREGVMKLLSEGKALSREDYSQLLSTLDLLHIREAFENFYNNKPAPDGVGLLSHYVAVVKHLAEVLKDHENIYNLDLLHEPYANLSCKLGHQAIAPQAYAQYFKSVVLPNAINQLIEGVRQVDQERTLFFQPPLFLGSLVELNEECPARFTLDNNIGFSVHPFSFGATPEEEKKNMAHIVQSYNDYCVKNGFGICITGCALPTIYSNECYFEACTEQFTSVHTAGFIKADMNALLDALVIPYAQLTAGTPEYHHIDRQTNVMEYRYATTSVTGQTIAPDACTEILVPARKYPEGYAAEVSGARIVSAATSPWLVLRNNPEAKVVSVKLYPIKGSRTDRPKTATGPTANVK